MALSHRRLNLLTGDWVLVSPQRLQRPWQGERDPPQKSEAQQHDDTCPLCPRVRRANGAVNPDYAGPFVFENDFPALSDQCEHGELAHFQQKYGRGFVSENALNQNVRPLSDGEPDSTFPVSGLDPLLVQNNETGACRVICYDPDHSLTLARMTVAGVSAILQTWRQQTADLLARRDIQAVTIFENRGAQMGASNPHPHGQIWATSSVPNELRREQLACARYWSMHGRSLLSDYLAREVIARERIVLENEHVTVLVPFWAAWPFETLILLKDPVARVTDLTDPQHAALADALRALMIRYDNLFSCPFPYTMGVHQAGADQSDWRGFDLHLHVFPPLLRSASVRKFMVGFEMLGMPQRDLTPEDAAARLRSCSDRHYLDG